MPSFALPPKETRVSVIDTLERTSATNSRELFTREADRLRRSGEMSQVLVRRRHIEGWITALPDLAAIEEGWNGYGSPAPSELSIVGAAKILREMSFQALLPESVRASAEGGVAIVFTGVQKRRAIIESLNSNEQFVLLYDRDGNNQTINWPVSGLEQRAMFSALRQHLGGSADATGQS